MGEVYLFVDVTNVAYGAWHALGPANLTNHGAAVGVVYGVCRTLQALARELGTSSVVACFDMGHSYRSYVYPGYKLKRKEARKQETEEEQAARAELNEQLVLLRTTLFPAAGVQCWAQPGTEADDLMAIGAAQVQAPDIGIILTSDEDLWQCCRAGVVWVRKPGSGATMTEDKFRSTYHGLAPAQWAGVKAWAGCTSDEIPGLVGVGTATAAKYLAGLLPPTGKAAAKFVGPGPAAVYNRNMQLTRVPCPGTVSPQLVPTTTPLAWGAIWEAIGAKHRDESYAEERPRGVGFGLR